MASGKAYRNLLGCVIELAGFESELEEDQEEVTISSNAKRLQLLTALNHHECISQEEKDQMFANIFNMSAEYCKKALAKVNAKI